MGIKNTYHGFSLHFRYKNILNLIPLTKILDDQLHFGKSRLHFWNKNKLIYKTCWGKQKAYVVCVCVCYLMCFLGPVLFNLKGPVPLQVYMLVVIREDRTDRVGAAGECA